jgi:hypothetical protein
MDGALRNYFAFTLRNYRVWRFLLLNSNAGYGAASLRN